MGRGQGIALAARLQPGGEGEPGGEGDCCALGRSTVRPEDLNLKAPQFWFRQPEIGYAGRGFRPDGRG